MTSAASPRFCPRCGAELPSDGRFCPGCGLETLGVRPPPGYAPAGYRVAAAEVGGEMLPLASIGKRFGALLIDALVLSIALYGAFGLVYLVAAATGIIDLGRVFDFASPGRGIFPSLAFLLVSTSVSWGFDAYGWSPGKAATGIRAVRMDGRRPGLVDGLVRYSMRTVGGMAFGLGYFWALWDERNQAWHDKLAGTVVVLVEPLQQRLPERRPEPVVVRARVWWLAVLGSFILAGSVLLNVWLSTTFDEGFWEQERFQPRQIDDSPRVFRPADVE